MPRASFSDSREAIAPTIVTSRPSRIQTVPSPSTTSQCQPLHGSRSMRAGMRVLKVSAMAAPFPTRRAVKQPSHGWMRRVALVLALLAAGCGGSDPQPRAKATAAPTEEATAAATPVKTQRPRLRDAVACTDLPDATCSTLRVPLDRRGATKGTLDLRVAVSGDPGKPVFVVLSGGPGEPGVPFVKRARQWLGPAVNQVRLVGIDQRG